RWDGASPRRRRSGSTASSPSRARTGCWPVPDVTPRRLVWWLVRAYPPRFRQDVGLGLVDAIQDRVDARRARSHAATTGFDIAPTTGARPRGRRTHDDRQAAAGYPLRAPPLAPQARLRLR